MHTSRAINSTSRRPAAPGRLLVFTSYTRNRRARWTPSTRLLAGRRYWVEAVGNRRSVRVWPCIWPCMALSSLESDFTEHPSQPCMALRRRWWDWGLSKPVQRLLYASIVRM